MGVFFHIFAPMKLRTKQTIGENLLYFMVWVVIILVPVLNSKMMSEEHVYFTEVLRAWYKISPYFLIFIIHNSIIAPKYLMTRSYGKYALWDIVLITAVFMSISLYQDYLIPDITESLVNRDSVQHGKASFTDLEIYWNVLLGLFMTGANMGIKLIYKSMRDEQEMAELKRQNLQTEMDYLKYQINPHFFMNTLNNIHALIDIDTESAKETVIDLSKMMRYVLYDSGKEVISLSNDIRFLKNYIELMRIRYTDDIDIKFDYPETQSSGISIPPLLLIVFVENAFKHGISYNGRSFIHLDIEYRNNKVYTTIVNSRHRSSVEGRKQGIGLDNVRKRLELIYGSNFTLQINDRNAEIYSVKLIIPTINA